ncbi:thioredoxin reductase-like selenoprotein T homolog CG3887 [Condylostylus longicornis]|uniref:thioredoxin reductase-like selenoprotein T homolog CG3887 n=1 Tax=Condylostylus longicornis TaxID=2530218 RepID=UPI00244DC339|nr:thioredoxin reductase-like selenoprotein T homolog CG3887 [Condylostylus longicornis]
MVLQKKVTPKIILALSCLLIIGLTDVTAEIEKEIPLTKLGQNVGGPTMTFLYCYSCGYRKAFEDYVGILNEKYPQITIRGANFDPPGFNLYLSKGVFAVKILLIVIVLTQFDIFGAMGQQIPSWWRFCHENKFYTCLMVFFVGNMLEAHLVSSGAFEISLNDVPVWSKLQTGRIPQPQELFQIIDSHLQFNQEKINDNPDFVK